MKTDARRAEQDAEIFRLRVRGHSLRAIAEEVGLSHQTVANRIQDAIQELVVPAAEQWRAEETARLHDLARAAYGVLDNAESGDTALKAIDRLLRISESRRKLWALDAPQPIDIALSRRADLEGELVGEALSVALEALDVAGLGGERERELKVYALALAQWKLGQIGGVESGPRPEPPPARPASAAAAVVEERADPQAAMDARMRELLADEDVDVDALLAEVDEEEGRTDG